MKLDIPHEQRPFSGEEVLLYYDGPLLFWMPHPSLRLLAVALEHDGNKCPFLVCEVSEEDAQALVTNRKTLRAVVLDARRHFHLNDYGDDELWLREVHTLEHAWLPGDVTLQPT